MTSTATERDLRTTDLALATYLHLEGFKHERMELMDRNKAVWVFSGTDEMHNVAQVYGDVQGSVEPQAFARTLREVRDDLYRFLRANR